jgi:glycosyltransferase involved in cell wall biosynthesis
VRITFLHSSNDVYGASRVLLGDVTKLVAQGHHVSVVVPANGPLAALQEIISDGYVIDGSLAVLRRVNPRDAARPPHLPAAARVADIVVLWTLPLALYGPMLRLRRQPYVVSVHERSDGVAGRVLLALALGHRTPTQVNSAYVRTWVARRVKADRIVLTYPSISSTAGAPPDATNQRVDAVAFSPQRPMRVLLVGRVSGHKGHLLAVQVAEEMKRRNRYLYLTLAGAPYPGQERHLEQLREAARRCGDTVSLVGEVPSMRSVAGGQDLLLMLSTRPEPFGITPLEAWQCGLPVIGIATGGAVESLALVNGMTTGDDVMAIANDLTLLYDDPFGAWRRPPDYVPGKTLCTEAARGDGWTQLLAMAMGNA